MAQTPVVLISEGGTQNYCNTEFYDSGGPNGAYGNNQDQTITFCPGFPGDTIQIGFDIVDITAGDVLIVYDGTSTSDPVLASSAVDALAGNLWTANNPTGCITVHFVSNGSGTGQGWTALIQCKNPCPQPTASFPPFPESPYKVCPYDTLLIDASASHAVPGRTIISYAWSIAGTTSYSTSPLVNLPTPVPGEFPISLQVMDDIGCVSTNSSAELVRVSTYPDFTGTNLAPLTICNGESATLTGHAQGRLWSSVPQPIIGGEFVLPDACPPPAAYTGYLNVSGFPAGTTINGATDILDICMTIEHSYLGDLTASLTCPDGSTVVLFNGNANGGGGTYLGGATDDSEGIPGIGAQYCFTPNAAWGTITQENSAGNWVIAGQPPNNSMPAGTYTPEGSFSAWDGCNLNGTWTLVVEDHLCIDDGTLFNVSMDINPALYPDVIMFTPVIGQGADSSYWTGPNIVSTSANADIATVTPDAPGNYPYTYTVMDDFGCTYDTTFHLNVTPGAVFEATTTPPCHGPVLLGEHFELPIPSGVLNYEWSPATALSNPNTAHPTADPAVDTWYHLHIYPTGHPLCGIVDSVFVPRISILENDSVVVDPLCFGQSTGTIQVATTGNGGPWDYQWTDGYGSVVRSTTASNGDTFTGPAGTYSVHITEGPSGSGCQDSLIATLVEPPLLEVTFVNADTTICLTGTAQLVATMQGGTAPLALNWDQGLVGDGPFQVSPSDTTTYAVYASDANNCQTQPFFTTVNVRPALQFGLPDTLTICPNVDTTLTAIQPFGGDGAYTFDWGAGPQESAMRAVNINNSQDLCVTLADGCETPPLQRCTWFVVKSLPPLVLTADTTLGCAPFAVHFDVQDTTDGAFVDWDFGDGSTVDDAPTGRDHGYTRAGHFTVSATVHWPNYCADSTAVPGMIVVEPMPDADFSWSPDPVSVLDPNVHFTDDSGPYAVQWAWDFYGQDTASGPEADHTFPGQIGGSYPVTLWTANYLGCADSVTKVLEVHDSFIVYVPNAFTPDGDGINDLLYVQGNDLSPDGFELMLFDRWGHSVFSTDDRNKPWDGKAKSGLAPQGVYVWKVKARSAYTGHDYEYLGHVTLVR